VNRYIQLFRIGNCVMGVLGVVLGTLVATGTGLFDDPLALIAACAVVFLVFVGGNSLNDYLDREVDKKAHPERPIPSGRIQPRTAKNIAAAAFVLSLAISMVLNPLSILIAISAVAIMLAYELWAKREGFLGNLSIAWLTGALFLFGGAIVGRIDATIAIGLMAFLATLGREIVKDIQDMDADFDRRTLPKRIGARQAGWVASAAFVAAVVLSFEPVAAGIFGLWYLAAVLFADVIFIYCAIVHFRNPKTGQSWAKYGMLVALVAFLLGGLL
jgi:geranylgeranylglycerol-phosphate geranylgeranyltransferase